MMNSPSVKSIRSPILRGDGYHIDSQLVNDAEQVIEIIHDREAKNFRLGIMLIVIAVTSWIVGLELVNAVLKDDSYQKPILFSCISGSCFSLNLIPDIINWFRTKFTSVSENDRHPPPLQPVEKFENSPTPLTKWETFSLAFQIAIIYLLYCICALSGLKYTSASNQTVLSSTTSIFTLFIGSLLNTDSFTVKKIVCTVVSFTGVLLVNFSETSHTNDNDNKFIPKDPKLGNALTLVGALLYAFYLIIMKLKLGNANKTTNETRLFGLVGLITIIISPPVLYMSNRYGLEPYQFPPPNNTILYLIIINGVNSYISDFSTILASLLTSPLITSLSLTSSVPITIFIDAIVLYLTGGSGHGNSKNSWLYIMGIISILSSVILINLSSVTELELIEQTIDTTLDEAIRNDEVLSPVLSPMLTSRPHSNFSSPLLPTKRDPLHKLSNLNLEGEQLINKNHSSSLYTVADLEPRDSETQDRGNIIVYGGNNHVYHVKHVDE